MNDTKQEYSQQIPNPFAEELAQNFYAPYYPYGYKGKGFQNESIDIKPSKTIWCELLGRYSR